MNEVKNEIGLTKKTPPQPIRRDSFGGIMNRVMRDILLLTFFVGTYLLFWLFAVHPVYGWWLEQALAERGQSAAVFGHIFFWKTAPDSSVCPLAFRFKAPDPQSQELKLYQVYKESRCERARAAKKVLYLPENPNHARLEGVPSDPNGVEFVSILLFLVPMMIIHGAILYRIWSTGVKQTLLDFWQYILIGKADKDELDFKGWILITTVMILVIIFSMDKRIFLRY